MLSTILINQNQDNHLPGALEALEAFSGDESSIVGGVGAPLALKIDLEMILKHISRDFISYIETCERTYYKKYNKWQLKSSMCVSMLFNGIPRQNSYS